MNLLEQDLEQILALVGSIRDTGMKIMMMSSGVSMNLRELFNVFPGSSTFFIGDYFPYHTEATIDMLERKPKNGFVRDTTAEALAAQAYWKGVEYCRKGGVLNPDVLGIGLTAAIETDGVRKSPRRVYVCFYTSGRSEVRLIEFEPSLPEDPTLTKDQDLLRRALKRRRETEVCSAFVLDSLLHFLNLHPLQGMLGRVVYSDILAPYDHVSLYSKGEIPYNLVAWNGCEPWEAPIKGLGGPDYLPTLNQYRDKVALMAGSFDPLHHAHRAVAEAVEQQTGRTVVYAISSVHPDKAVDVEDLKRRMNQFRSYAPVILHDNAPLFIDKARLHPGVPLVMGADAAYKLLSPTYYKRGQQEVEDVLAEFERLGTVLFVCGRVVKGMGPNCKTCRDLPIPNRYRHLFEEVTTRVDFSSTQIREAR